MMSYFMHNGCATILSSKVSRQLQDIYINEAVFSVSAYVKLVIAASSTQGSVFCWLPPTSISDKIQCELYTRYNSVFRRSTCATNFTIPTNSKDENKSKHFWMFDASITSSYHEIIQIS
jgi:hypothetical protein